MHMHGTMFKRKAGKIFPPSFILLLFLLFLHIHSILKDVIIMDGNIDYTHVNCAFQWNFNSALYIINICSYYVCGWCAWMVINIFTVTLNIPINHGLIYTSSLTKVIAQLSVLYNSLHAIMCRLGLFVSKAWRWGNMGPLAQGLPINNLD